ncbi:hypothetical protein T02_10280 [Trichinella nativa]|uniref:Uncharacterized protein n=1 Tax=Trichinella nativa TaxID=6335 RepID=A0A0V1KPD6_9BILA|nr:hypothetical protein T02_10280 [Trichinella nativa]
MLIEQCFNLTNLIQMWRRTLNQCAFRRKLTVINWNACKGKAIVQARF